MIYHNQSHYQKCIITTWMVSNTIEKPEQENSDIDYKVNISSYHQADLKINNKNQVLVKL